jgi:hypothetical protein
MSSSASTHSTPNAASPEPHAKSATPGRSEQGGWRRRRRQEERRSPVPRSFLDAAIRLFGRRGIGQTSMAEAAEEFGYSCGLAWPANRAASAPTSS